MTEPNKTCLNCGHRIDSHSRYIEYSRCARNLRYCSTNREFPDYYCDENFSGWIPVPEKLAKKSLAMRLIDWWCSG